MQLHRRAVGQPLKPKAEFLRSFVCRWNADEADTYLRHLDAQRAVRSGAGWALDAGWLEGQGVEVPSALKALDR